MNTPNVIDPHVRLAILHALTVADRRQKSNPYALAHYFKALENVELMMDAGMPLRQALKTAYCGPLVNKLVKAAGLEPLTDTEIREVR